MAQPSQNAKKMVFVLPPGSIEGQKSSPSHHPIMTATLAAVAREAGAEVAVIDSLITGQSYRDILHEITISNVDWVGIMPFEYRRELPLDFSLRLANLIKESGLSVAVGLLNCPLNNNNARNAVGKEVDFVCFGDSEFAVEEYARNGEFNATGVCFNGPDGIVHNSSAKTTEINYQIPAWDLFAHHLYRPSAHRYIDSPVLPVMASRSCPFGCDFCPHTLYNTSDSYSSRDVKSVVNEIAQLQRLYSVKNIEFYDPTFGVHRETALELCRQLEELNLGIGWSCYSRCDLLDEELLTAMKNAGCHTILFGVESGDNKVLHRTGKEIDLNQVKQTVAYCQKLNIQTIASFILGLPLDNVTSLKKTIRFACELNPTFAQFHQARAFFTHSDWQELGTVSSKWEETSTSVNGLAYIPNELTLSQIQWFLFKAYACFYLRPNKVKALLRQVRTLSDAKRYARGGQQIASQVLHLRAFA